MIVFTFPGQGSQKIGMGLDLFESSHVAKETFQMIDDKLNFKLSSLMFNGDEKELSLTINTQPALMAVSMAVLSVLEKDFGFKVYEKVSYVAGHSLGEYSALCVAKSLSIADAALVLQARGKAMLEASPVGVGSMVAVLGKTQDEVLSLIENSKIDGEICVIANDNVVGQIVVSGHMASIDSLCAYAKANNVKAIKLPVSGAFHSPLMQQAADKLSQVLEGINFSKLEIPIIPNLLATSLQDETQIKDLLIKQVTGSVRWRETLDFLTQQGTDMFVELGQGSVLTGLAKKANSSAQRFTLQTMKDIEDFVSKV